MTIIALAIACFAAGWVAGGIRQYCRAGGTYDQQAKAAYAWRLVRLNAARASKAAQRENSAKQQAASAHQVLDDLAADAALANAPDGDQLLQLNEEMRHWMRRRQ